MASPSDMASPSKRYPVSTGASPPRGQVDKAQLLLDADRQASRVAQLLEDDRQAMEEEEVVVSQVVSQEWDIRWPSTERSPAAPSPAALSPAALSPAAPEIGAVDNGMLHPAHRPVNRSASQSPKQRQSPSERPPQQPYRPAVQGVAPAESRPEPARAAGQALRATSPRVPMEMLPDRSTMSPEDVQYARVRDLRERLVAFYRIFAPQKVPPPQKYEPHTTESQRGRSIILSPKPEFIITKP